MPVYVIETHEWFEATVTYTVEAESEVAAQELVITGGALYDSHEHPGNHDYFGEVTSCVQQLDGERGEVFLVILLLLSLLIFLGSGLISTLAVAGK